MQRRTTRRRFLESAAATTAALTILPSGLARGYTANEKLDLAFIGVGGRGASNLRGLQDQNVVALCDVDDERAKGTFEKLPDAKRFHDFRSMLDQVEKRIDGVVVSTPDHTHATAVMNAIRRGKHVYCEKPLAHSVHEIRALRKAAKEHNVVTQLGNQGHSSESIRRFCEWIGDGAIGPVHTVHAWCGSSYSRIDQLPLLKEKHDAPPTLNWDLWLGPATYRPYHPVYLPGSWRGWMPFGTGTIGDWVCHVVDPVFWALDLGAPVTIEADAPDYDPQSQGDTFPGGTHVRYEFPANGDRGPVTLHWYDGTYAPPRPAALEPERKMSRIGAVVEGETGGILHGSHGAGGVRLFPETKMRAYEAPAATIPRVASHHDDWVQAIRKGTQAGSNFEYGGPLTEIALLGVIATRLLGTRLQWHGEEMRFADCEPANELLNPPYRDGWKL